MSYANGGYLTAWSPFPQFKPHDGELVIIHHNWWKEKYGEPAIYHEKQKVFERGNFSGIYDEDCIDYWMRIPPLPEELI